MKNNYGFTLMELLAVIVVLAIVSVIGTSTVLPLLSNVRESAFRVGATNAVKSADSAIRLVELEEQDYTNDGTNCKIGKKVCFTIDTLVKWGVNDGEIGTYKGKVVVDTTDSNNPVYTLYFQKNAEFSFIKQHGKDGEKMDISSSANWLDEYNSCTCGDSE